MDHRRALGDGAATGGVYDGTNKPLADEEAAGFAIINSLSDEKLSEALIHPVSPADFSTRYVPRIGSVEYPDVIDLGMPPSTG